MYLALRPPWAGRGTSPSDAAVVAVAPGDAGVAKPKKKPRGQHHRPPSANGGGNPGQVTSGDDPSWTANDPGEETELPPQLIPLTPADRALEWRGDDTTKPTQKIDMGAASEARALDDGEIQSTISAQSGGVQSCVVQAAANTNLAGTINVRMIVDGGSGHVTKSKLQAPHYMFEHGLLACVKGTLAHMKFPATGAATLVTMPINFN